MHFIYNYIYMFTRLYGSLVAKSFVDDVLSAFIVVSNKLDPGINDLIDRGMAMDALEELVSLANLSCVSLSEDFEPEGEFLLRNWTIHFVSDKN